MSELIPDAGLDAIIDHGPRGGWLVQTRGDTSAPSNDDEWCAYRVTDLARELRECRAALRACAKRLNDDLYKRDGLVIVPELRLARACLPAEVV